MVKIKNKQWYRSNNLSTLIKLILGFTVLYFVIQNLTKSPQDRKVLIDLLNPLFLSTWQKTLLLITIILMPVNWLLEANKWQYAAKFVKKISLKKALLGTICGVSISFLFPNRTGDFAGKLLYFPVNKRVKGLAASIMASFSQFAISISIGALIVSFFFPFEKQDLPIHKSYVLSILVLIPTISLVAFFLSDKIGLITPRNSRLKRLFRFIKVFSLFNIKTKLMLMNLSFWRYLVYCFQFSLLLMVFTNSFNLVNFLFAPISFFASTIIPSFTFAGVGVREFINLTLSDFFSINRQAAVLAGFCLWMLNVLVPSLFGIVLIFRAKLFRN